MRVYPNFLDAFRVQNCCRWSGAGAHPALLVYAAAREHLLTLARPKLLDDRDGRVAYKQLSCLRKTGSGVSGHSGDLTRTALVVKGFGRLRTKASSAGTRGPHALVYG